MPTLSDKIKGTALAVAVHAVVFAAVAWVYLG